MTDPWDWYIYLHEWLMFVVNVGEYTSPMHPSWVIDHYTVSSSQVVMKQAGSILAVLFILQAKSKGGTTSMMGL